jgi:hypothetical protein
MTSTNEASEQAAPGEAQQGQLENVSKPSMMASALALAARGLRVFPCKPRQKIPDSDHGHLDATVDAKTIKRRWTETADANIGLRPDASGFVVVDVDTRNGGYKTLEALEAELGPCPDTVVARTGCREPGLHLYYRVPAGMEFRGKLGDGIDIKYRGYVLAPPSIHPDGGRYEWLSSPFDTEVAELPPAWLARMKKTDANNNAPPVQLHKGENSTTTSAYGAVAIEEEIRAVRTATQGERNNRLNRAAFALGQLNAGGEVVDIREALVQAAMEVGLPEHEARRTVDSGWSAGQSEPRMAPKDASGGSGEPGHGGAECDWEPPVGLEGGALPEFPIAALPAPLAEYAAAVAKAVQVPVDMPGVLILGALSAACGRDFVVQVADGYIEPVNLYLVVAMDPGNRKSAAISKMIAPIEAYERQLREERKVPVAIERAEYDAFVKRLEETKREAAKAAPEDQPAALAAVREAAADLETRRLPVLPRLLADDITSEKQVSLLVEHGSMAMLSPEGGVFDIIGGRYSGGEPNLDVYLKAHTGEPITVDRMNRPSEHVARPILTLCLTVQIIVLRRLAEKRDFRGRGLVARFLYSIPPSLLGKRAVDPPPVPADLSRAYEQLLRTLLVNAGGPIEDPRMLRLSGEARAAWLAFCTEHEPRLGDGGDFASMTDWAGKLPGAIIRIAGLLHAAQFPGAPTDTPISAATMASAIALGRYFTSHALAAFAIMGADPTLDGARHILAWLKRIDASSFVLRDAFQALKGTFRKVDELRAALAILEERSYIRQRPEGRREGPGRKPSPTYNVNPLWLRAATCSHNSQNPQNSDPITPPTNSGDCENYGNGSGSGLEDSVASVAAMTEANSGNCEDSGKGFGFAENAEQAAGEEPAEFAGGQAATSNNTEEGFL